VFQERDPAVDIALGSWRQGDVCLDTHLEFVHVGDLSRPSTDAAVHAASLLQEQGNEIPLGPVSLSEEVPKDAVVFS
jgi:hypothetical protein